jgi:transposase
MQSPTNHYSKTNNNFNTILKIVTKLYQKLVPDEVKNRKNIEVAIQSDEVIISTIIWGLVEGHPSQSATYRSVKSNLFPDKFPSRSRYSRTCANLARVIKLIRSHYMKEISKNPPLGAIDSMPIPLCAPVRNRTAKVLSSEAAIGYNATKEFYFYGFKFHAIVSSDGHLSAYLLTPANIHDIQAVHELVDQVDMEVIVGDKGYIGNRLRKYLRKNIGTDLISIPRRSMKVQLNTIEKKLMKQRKKVETVFSSLGRLGFQKFQNRSELGFISRLESILFAYSFLLSRAQEIEPHTLKYSLGYFD